MIETFIAAITNRDWFDYQKSHGFIDRINFWTPTRWRYKDLRPGVKMVFKLKGSGDFAGGYGIIQEYKYQSLEETWNEFGRRNGFDNKTSFLEGLCKTKSGISLKCGCIVLSDVVFWDKEVKLSDYNLEFKTRGTQTGKTYTCSFPFSNLDIQTETFSLVQSSEKKKRTQSVTDRDGQGEFHAKISRTYHHKCCISGEEAPELLQAAHIQDYINKESNHVQNGLLLRIDLHKLFDNGLLYIDDHYVVHISPLVKSEDYRKYDGKILTLPKQKSDWPSLNALQIKEKSFRR